MHPTRYLSTFVRGKATSQHLLFWLQYLFLSSSAFSLRYSLLAPILNFTCEDTNTTVHFILHLSVWEANMVFSLIFHSVITDKDWDWKVHEITDSSPSFLPEWLQNLEQPLLSHPMHFGVAEAARLRVYKYLSITELSRQGPSGRVFSNKKKKLTKQSTKFLVKFI